MFRVIYMVEAFDLNGETSDDVLVARRFAANMKTVNKIKTEYKGYEIVVRRTHKNEHSLINPKEVERM